MNNKGVFPTKYEFEIIDLEVFQTTLFSKL